MAGTVIVDTINSSVAGTPPVFQANGTEIGTLCRAWVNFNGTGTVAIRASFNVSSITDGGTGIYTVNFTNAMPDANYAAIFDSGTGRNTTETDAFAAGYVEVTIKDGAGGALDQLYVSCAIFR
jgi:hypothetical protein